MTKIRRRCNKMQIKNFFGRLFVFFAAFVLIAAMCPFNALAEEEAAQGEDRDASAQIRVRLIIENNIWNEEEGAPWSGVLADTYVEMHEHDVLASAVCDKLADMGKSAAGIEAGKNICIEDISDGEVGADCVWK